MSRLVTPQGSVVVVDEATAARLPADWRPEPKAPAKKATTTTK